MKNQIIELIKDLIFKLFLHFSYKMRFEVFNSIKELKTLLENHHITK
jgi:hypothetical protein